MTAKELAKSHISILSAWVDFNPATSTTENIPAEYKFTKKEFEAFCAQLCDEQRNQVKDDIEQIQKVTFSSKEVVSIILNAKQPEL